MSCQVAVFSRSSSRRPNLVDVTRVFEYLPSAEVRSHFVQLDIVTWEDFRLVVDFHGFGPKYRGVMAVAAYSYRREPGPSETDVSQSSANPLSPVRPAMSNLFQFNYVENPESIEKRFRGWLENESW